jgi:hypothetical protein
MHTPSCAQKGEKTRRKGREGKKGINESALKGGKRRFR